MSSLKLPENNFAGWQKIGANFYFPQQFAADDHIHVTGSIVSGTVTVDSVSIKIAGTSKNLPPRSAIYGFTFNPKPELFPPNPLGDEYRAALKQAGLIQ